MSDKTARHYRDDATLPSVRKKSPRTYRTRLDPFAAVWPEVQAQLHAEPKLLAKTLFDWLRQQHPGQFLDSHRRTFERRVRQWRASNGPGKLAIFRQVHEAGDLAASDFTHMTSLGITIARPAVRAPGLPLRADLLELGVGERLRLGVVRGLVDGLQNALWELGGVPRRHRSDSLSAAVNNLSATREFQTRYRDLLAHYGLAGQRINARQAHENGDAESSHGHFKTAVDQALLLRGSRDFASREEYAAFLHGVVATRNAGRRARFAEELAAAAGPARAAAGQLPARLRCRVDSGSLIHIHRNIYSVHSRLIGEWVEARLYADRVEVWYAEQAGRHAAAAGGPGQARGPLPARHRLAGAQAGRLRQLPLPRRPVPDQPLPPGLRPAAANASANAVRPRNTWDCCTTRRTTAKRRWTTRCGCCLAQ